MLENDAAPLNTDNFAEMLGGDGDNEQTEQSASQNDDTEQEEVTETADEGTDDAQEGDDAADDKQDEQTDKDSTEAFLELEINGEKVTVSKDEAKNGYLRQQDYTQKTQALAVERQAAQQHIEKQFAEVQQMSQEIGQLTSIDAALNQYAQVDWDALKEADPLSYLTHMTELNNLRAQRGDVVNAIGTKQQQLSAMQAQRFAQQTIEAKAHLEKAIPGFGKEHLAAMKEYGARAGFKPEELATVADGRMMETLWKAAQYDRMQADTKKAVKTVAALPTKASKAAPVAKPAAQVQTEKLARRVAQTGNVRDFAALLGSVS